MNALGLFLLLAITIQIALGSIIRLSERSSVKKLIPRLNTKLFLANQDATKRGHPMANYNFNVFTLRAMQERMADPNACMDSQNYKYVQSHFKAAMKQIKKGMDIAPTIASARDNFYLNLRSCQNPETRGFPVPHVIGVPAAAVGGAAVVGGAVAGAAVVNQLERQESNGPSCTGGCDGCYLVPVAPVDCSGCCDSGCGDACCGLVEGVGAAGECCIVACCGILGACLGG